MESADNFEFSAEGLSENTKTIKITLLAEVREVSKKAKIRKVETD